MMSHGCSGIMRYSAVDPFTNTAYVDDDKNYKTRASSMTCGGGFGLFSFQNGIRKDMNKFKKNPFCIYALFLAAFYICYILGGGCLSKSTREDKLGYISCILEAAGLISLQWKVSHRGHVEGLSGMSMIMFTLTYSMREFETFCVAKVPWVTIDGMALEMLQLASCALAYVNLWSIFKTYRRSYQEELDVLKVKYLIPGCVLLGLVLHPHFRQGWKYSLSWSMSFYVDVLALLPQVVMMQRGNGKVEAPIAHFVAATALSRMNDLGFWYYRWNLGPQGWWHGINISGMIIVGFHIISLLLVADFMYYYIKARMSGQTMSEDMSIPTLDDDIC